MALQKNTFGTLLAISLISFSGFAIGDICTIPYADLNSDIETNVDEMCDKCFDSAKGKVSGSEQKANIGKIADAIRKLDDFGTDLNSWLADNKPKITQAAHDVLAADIDSVIDCLNTVHP